MPPLHEALVGIQQQSYKSVIPFVPDSPVTTPTTNQHLPQGSHHLPQRSQNPAPATKPSPPTHILQPLSLHQQTFYLIPNINLLLHSYHLKTHTYTNAPHPNMPNPPPSPPSFLPLTTHYLSSLLRLLSYRKILLLQLTLASFILLFHLSSYLASSNNPLTPEPRPHLSTRGDDGSYAGFKTRPQTEKCYKQEKVATLLGVFLGIFGADHWYAR